MKNLRRLLKLLITMKTDCRSLGYEDIINNLFVKFSYNQEILSEIISILLKTLDRRKNPRVLLGVFGILKLIAMSGGPNSFDELSKTKTINVLRSLEQYNATKKSYKQYVDEVRGTAKLLILIIKSTASFSEFKKSIFYNDESYQNLRHMIQELVKETYNLKKSMF